MLVALAAACALVGCAEGMLDGDAGGDASDGAEDSQSGTYVGSGAGDSGGADVGGSSAGGDASSGVGGTPATSAQATTATTASSSGSGGGTTVSSAASSSSTGGGTGDIWFEIEYGSNSTPTSPGWEFSPTPWSGMDWATQGQSWPEAWDPFQSMQVNFDPMGSYALIIDSSEHLQAMIGLQDLIDYQEAIVRLEGRGYSTSSSAHFDVYNPLNDCGISNATMAHDWSLHLVEVNLGSCLVPGGGVQAIRVAPTSQGLALVRMRLTIKGAVY